MEKILEKYKNRLIDVSTRNKTLYLNKLYKKQSFDIYSLEKFEKGISEKILNHVIKRRKGKIVLLDNPYRWRENDKIRNIMSEQSSLDELQKKVFEEKISYSQSLKTLSREINFIERETGRYELYVGYPYVEGKFKTGNYVKAPLFLFPVSIFKSNDNWYLENLLEEDVAINKVFLIAYSKFNEEKLTKEVNEMYEEMASPLKLLRTGDFKGVLEFFSSIGIEIKENNNTSKFIEAFQEGRNDKIPTGILILRYYAILGIFHLGSSIYNDYSDLKKYNNHEIIKTLLGQVIEKDEENDSDEKVEEKDLYYISELDFTQERAIKKSEKNKSLVIYGPPGTGKSQTIENIIANNLVRGKKVLMISEKRVALDVIYNRLPSGMREKIVLIHDAKKDKKAFYEKIRRLYENIVEKSDSNFESRYQRDGNIIEEYTKKIDESVRKLDILNKYLFEKRDFGLSLQEMFLLSKRKLSENEMKIFRFFKQYFSRYEKITYAEIKQITEKSSDKVESYIKLRNYESSFEKIIPIVTNSLSEFDVDELIENIKGILNEYEKVKVSLNSRYKQDIKELFLSGEYKNLDEFVQKINMKENKKIFLKLKKLEKNQWWNPFYYFTKSKRLKKISMLTQELEKAAETIYSEIIEDYNSLKKLIMSLDFLKDVVCKHEYKNILNDLVEEKDIADFLKNLLDYLEVYNEYRSLKYEFGKLTELEFDFLDFSFKMNKMGFCSSSPNIVEKLPYFFILREIEKIQKVEKLEIDSLINSYESMVKEVKKLISKKMNLIPIYIKNYWDERFYRTTYNNQKLSKEFKRRASMKRKLWPIRKFIKVFGELVLELFPCFLLTPETVSEILPLEMGIFDLVIFDEASQIFIEKSIPSIFRGKKVVVAGDDKQLRPTSFFMIRNDEEYEDDEEENLESAAAIEEESLLDLAKVNFKSTHLRFHYRSRYEELINFSNCAFYDRKLYISPNIENVEKPIEVIKVKGTWESRQNLEEARRVVELVKKILKEKSGDTIGVITFNVTQKDLIEDLLDEETRNDEEFLELYNRELSRRENYEDKGIFVKNIENVQGDERDIIIFSIGYAPDRYGKVRAYFGALNQYGGENRLNVAISRAKKKIYIVTSIEPEDLNVEATKHLGPKLLKEYLKYSRAISKGNKTETQEILNSLSDISPEETNFESPLEEEIYNRLSKSGIIQKNKLRLKTQVNSAGYRIDIAVYDPKRSKYILGIECDGALYHSSKSARERDIHRQRFLESRGWKIVRIWSRNWWENPENEIRKIEDIIENTCEFSFSSD